MSRDRSQPLIEHLDELRSRLITCAVALVVGVVVAFVARNWIFDLMVDPYTRVVTDRDLVFFRPTEAFSLFMRLSLFGGFILASPVIIWQVWAFVSPALSPREKRFMIPLVASLVILFLGGVVFGYWALQRGLGFLVDFGGDRLEPTIGGDYYLSFAMRFLLVFGLAFEFPVFLYATAAVGVVGWRKLAAGRQWALVAILVVGAVATPSGDPLTLLLLSIPLYLLYEATIWLVRFTLRR